MNERPADIQYSARFPTSRKLFDTAEKTATWDGCSIEKTSWSTAAGTSFRKETTAGGLVYHAQGPTSKKTDKQKENNKQNEIDGF